MFDDVIRRMEQMFGGSLKSSHQAQPVEVGDTPPTEVFPIPSQYTYCALMYTRRVPEIELNVQQLGTPRTVGSLHP